MRGVRHVQQQHRGDDLGGARRVRVHAGLDDGGFRPLARRREAANPGQKIYSGNQGNVEKWAPELRKYVDKLQEENYSYRYIGALVGDFHRTLLYGGIWLYPPDASAPEGKARLLYEVAPMGFLAEQAGGLAMWGEMADKRVMEVVPQHIHQRSPMFCGSKDMVEGLQKFLVEEKARATVKA